MVHETYASTEAGLITVASSADALARPGTAGRPAGAAEVRIYDESGRPCAPGEIGMIYGRQPAYPDFTYHNLPDARRAIERDGLVTLGDVGYLDADGYLFVCDRGADMVLSGGVNIYPAEIEHALLRLPGVLDCAVIGVPDPEFGERLHAFVQPEPGAELVPGAARGGAAPRARRLQGAAHVHAGASRCRATTTARSRSAGYAKNSRRERARRRRERPARTVTAARRTPRG